MSNIASKTLPEIRSKKEDIILKKQFDKMIGRTGYGAESFRVKVVYKKLKNTWMVVTAYPI